MKVSHLIEHLARNYRPDDPIAYSLWTSEDVRCLAEQEGRAEPSSEDCERILESFHDYHDAEHGLNWQTLAPIVRDALKEGGSA